MTTMRERLERAQDAMHEYSPDFSQEADEFLDGYAVQLVEAVEEIVGQWEYDGDISRAQYERLKQLLTDPDDSGAGAP